MITRDDSALLSNRFIRHLPRSARALVERELELVDLRHAEVLYPPGARIRELYFPCGSVISIVTQLAGKRSVEALTVGLEGMVGLPVFLRTSVSAHRVITQVAGRAARMPAARLDGLLAEAPRLGELLARYTDATITSMSQSAACLAAHPVLERCARWLLTTADRTGSPEFHLTHEFLAQMLGVQRPTVTIAAGALQTSGLIRYHRGDVAIIDRAGLEAASCECYGTISEAFDRVFEASRR